MQEGGVWSRTSTEENSVYFQIGSSPVRDFTSICTEFFTLWSLFQETAREGYYRRQRRRGEDTSVKLEVRGRISEWTCMEPDDFCKLNWEGRTWQVIDIIVI